MRFGAHVSIAKHLYEAVGRAKSIGCEAMQIFPGNPRGWQAGYFKSDEMEEFKSRREHAAIWPLAVHLPYLVNLGSPVERVFEASLGSIKDTLAKAKLVEADYLVMHVGSHLGTGRAAGLARLKAGLEIILKEDFRSVKLLLENTAGAGFTFGDRLEELAEIMETVDYNPSLGFCLDTCHAYAAGYNLADWRATDRFFQELDDLIGLDKLGLIHANDCKGGLGDHIDRHEQIGDGSIGIEGWRHLLAHPALQEQTFIIETPRPAADDDRRNLQTLRQLSPYTKTAKTASAAR